MSSAEAAAAAAAALGGVGAVAAWAEDDATSVQAQRTVDGPSLLARRSDIPEAPLATARSVHSGEVSGATLCHT